MSKSNTPERIDPVDLISEHYEATEISDSFRRDISNRTRAVVAARRRMPMVRWAASLAGAAALIAVFALCWHFLSVPPSNESTGHQGRLSPGPQPGTEPKVATREQSGSRDVKSAPRTTTPHANKTAMRPDVKTDTQYSAPKHAPSLGAPMVVVISAQQPVKDGSGRALSVGDRVASGDTVRTGKGGRIALVTRRGSELNLDSNSELVLTANDTAKIHRGRLYCRNRDREIARIDTPAGHVKLLGTVVDTNVVRKDTVAVTVVEGRVQLSNRLGSALVDAGKRAMLVAYRPPQVGAAVNTRKETSWYHGRGDYQSDFGDIAYMHYGRGLAMTEIWTMRADGSGKHRVRSLIGRPAPQNGQWLPGERWLSVSLYSLPWYTTPPKLPRAAIDSHQPIIPDRMLLLDAATGQATPVDLPESYFAFYRSFAPDASLMAFTGTCRTDAGLQSGLWVLDTRNGGIKRVLSGDIRTAAAWAADSRHLAISKGKGNTIEHDLVIVDALTGDQRVLGINGAGACFSPDGTKLAYSGEFGGSRESYYMGVPDTGSIFVLDLVNGGTPVRVSSGKGGALLPRWSPDGRRLLFVATDEGGVYVVEADGSGLKKVYPNWLSGTPSWVPRGEGIYLWGEADREKGQTLLLVAADGSGVIRTLAQTAADSTLPPNAQAQTDAATAAITEAVNHFGEGKVRSFEGDAAGARQSYSAAAGIFSSLVWDYPLSGLGVDDTQAYAEAAGKQAVRSDAEVLHESCRERVKDLGFALCPAVAAHKQFPTDLSTLLSWTSSESWQAGWLRSNDTEHVTMLGGCPGAPGVAGASYVYTAPEPGTEPAIGDVLFRCPLHPDVCFRWDDYCVSALHQVIAESNRAGKCDALIRGLPYRYEHIGDKPLTIIRRVLSDTFEVKGSFKLLPLGKTYSDGTFSLALDEGAAARAIDAAGHLDWGNLPDDQSPAAIRELEFCRCVARFEAGQTMDDCEFLKRGGIYTTIDGEPARQLYGGQAEGSCGAPGTHLRFELIGPDDIRLYQLKPTGRFRVHGTVRVQQTGNVCTNGWIDKAGNVIATEN